MVQTLSFPPGPSFGSSQLFLKDPLDYMMFCKNKFGNVVRLNMGFGNLLLVFGADEVAEASKDVALGRSATADLFSPLFGGSLIEADGEKWKNQRASLSKSIRPSRLKEISDKYNEITHQVIDEMLKSNKKTGYVDVQQSLYAFTSESLAHAFFGQSLGFNDAQTIVDAWSQSLEFMSRRLASRLPLPMWVPTLNNVRLQNQANKINAALKEATRISIENSSTLNCLKAILLDSHDNKTSSEVQHDIFLQTRAAFLAALDNTATSITWLIYYLALYPDLQEEVREEMNRVNEDSSSVYEKKYPLLESCFYEAIRLNPPLWIVDRTATEDTSLGGFDIPKDSTIIMSPYVTHRDPLHWKEPLVFDPRRFIDKNVNSEHRCAYYPFGVGRFKCPGINQGLLMAKIFSNHVLKKYKFGLHPWSNLKFDHGLVLRTGKLNMVFEEV